LILLLTALFAKQLRADFQCNRPVSHVITRTHAAALGCCIVNLIRSVDPNGVWEIYSFRVLLLMTVNSLAFCLLTAVFIIYQTTSVAAKITGSTAHFGPLLRAGYWSVGTQAIIGNSTILIDYLLDLNSYVFMVTPFTSCIALVMILCCTFYIKGVRKLREGIKHHALVVAGRGVIRQESHRSLVSPSARTSKQHKDSLRLPEIIIDDVDSTDANKREEKKSCAPAPLISNHNRARSRHMKLELLEHENRHAMEDIQANPVLSKVWNHLHAAFRTALILYAIGIPIAIIFALVTVVDTDRSPSAPRAEDRYDVSKAGYNWVIAIVLVWYLWYMWNAGDTSHQKKRGNTSGTHSHSADGSKKGSTTDGKQRRRSLHCQDNNLKPNSRRGSRRLSTRRSQNGAKRSGSFPRSGSLPANSKTDVPPRRSVTTELMSIPTAPDISDGNDTNELVNSTISGTHPSPNASPRPSPSPTTDNLLVPTVAVMPGTSSDASVSDIDSLDSREGSTDTSDHEGTGV